MDDPDLHSLNYSQFFCTKASEKKYTKKKTIFNKWFQKNWTATCRRELNHISQPAKKKKKQLQMDWRFQFKTWNYEIARAVVRVIESKKL